MRQSQAVLAKTPYRVESTAKISKARYQLIYNQPQMHEWALQQKAKPNWNQKNCPANQLISTQMFNCFKPLSFGVVCYVTVDNDILLSAFAQMSISYGRTH